jgi:hypothetical protein
LAEFREQDKLMQWNNPDATPEPRKGSEQAGMQAGRTAPNLQPTR